MQRGVAALLVCLLLAVVACSSGEDTPGMASGPGPGHSTGGSRSTSAIKDASSDDAGDAGAAGTTCTIGESKACRVVLGTYQGQENCFVGMQYCDTGVWTSCIDKRDAN